MRRYISNYSFYTLIICALLLFKGEKLFAQESNEDEVYEFCDELPTFKDYQNYFAENISYPDEALNNNIQGTVYLDIIVGKTGEIKSVIVRKDPGHGLGEEAKRVVSEMPHWSPGMQNGKPVNVRITIPIK